MAITTRRTFLLGSASLLLPALARPAAAAPAGIAAGLDAIEATLAGGRLGVAVEDTGSGQRLGHRADELFPMCSTFKMLLAAAVLSRVDAGQETLDRRISYKAHDLLEYAPVTRKHEREGAMSVRDLCAAAVVWSDNTAANLLLHTIDGPAGLTRYAAGIGDDITRLDRTEPTLNEARPEDPRDTTTPHAILDDMKKLFLGKALSAGSRDMLEGWMRDSTTGLKRLRAGLPKDWQAADKTGTGENGTGNVVAILRPPGRAPILVGVYVTGSKAGPAGIDAAHAEVGRLIASAL